MGIILVFLASCNPIDDRDSLGQKATLSQIKLTVTHTTSNTSGKLGNEFIVTNLTPQYGGQWDLLVKKSNNVTDTVALPFLGKFTFVYYATTAGGVIMDSIPIQVDTIDRPTNPIFNFISGGGTGRTWVWGINNPESTNHIVWGVGPNNDANNAGPVWWGVPHDATFKSQSIDSLGTMTFDLIGGANYTKVENGVTSHGNFAISGTGKSPVSIGQITFTGGTTILRGISQNDGQIIVYQFDIVKSNDNELELGYPDHNAGESWYWVFKQQGYSFP